MQLQDLSEQVKSLVVQRAADEEQQLLHSHQSLYEAVRNIKACVEHERQARARFRSPRV
jgi:hypothetical protein